MYVWYCEGWQRSEEGIGVHGTGVTVTMYVVTGNLIWVQRTALEFILSSHL